MTATETIQEAIERMHRDGELVGKHFLDVLLALPVGEDRDDWKLQQEVRRALRALGLRIVDNVIAGGDDSGDRSNIDASMSLERLQSELLEHACGRQPLTDRRADEIVAGMLDPSRRPVSGTFSLTTSMTDARATELADMLENPRAARGRPAGAFSMTTPRDAADRRHDELCNMLQNPHASSRQRVAASFSMDPTRPTAYPGEEAFMDEARTLLSQQEFAELQELFALDARTEVDERRQRLLAIISMMRGNIRSKAKTYV